jgi:hypothetical protein
MHVVCRNLTLQLPDDVINQVGSGSGSSVEWLSAIYLCFFSSTQI